MQPGLRTVEQLRDLVTRLHHQPRRKLTLLVGIDGPDGAGKTSFSTALATFDPAMTVVGLDDFGDRELDWRRLRNQLLLPLQGNRPTTYQCYDAASATLGRWREVGVGGIVIVEGLYACMRQLVAAYDFRIVVTAPREVLLRRRQERGDVRVAGPVTEEAYLAEQDPAASAHLVVDGSGEVACDRDREYVRVRT